MTMKKAILLLLSVGIISGVAVACGGPDVENENNVDGIVPASDDITDGMYTGGDFTEGNDEFEYKFDNSNTDDDMHIDWGSDITFDDVNIILPGEGDDCNIDMTRPYYIAKNGTVASIETRGAATYVTIEDADGVITVLLVGEDTLFPFSNRIEVGDIVTGWFPANAPAPAIYPPQYMAAVFAAGVPDGVNVRVNLFETWEGNDDGYYISHDGLFAFRIDENTEVVLEDGVEFIGDEFDGRRIIVIYGVSTRSIPEMTVASKLIVLYENIAPVHF